MYKKIILTLFFGFFVKAEEADHLIFSKITITPNQAEMIAIYNPTSSTINLSNYYLSDAEYSPVNIHYYNLPSGTDYIWSFASTDFVVRFKNTDEIDSGETKYISLAAAGNFENYYGFEPDFIMQNDMLSAIDGQNSISTQANLLNDSYEVLILFYWDGNPNSLVQDVDYFYWGDPQGLPFYGVNKTGVSTYAPDTDFTVQEQNILPLHTDGYTYKRVSLTEEIGELGPENSITGNGITLHDETSEDFTASWEIIDEIGCMNSNDPNYNPDAIIDDGSCVLKTISEIVNNCSYNVDDTIECDGKYELTNSSANECPLYETSIVTTGLVVDYFDIEPYDGPRSFTIRDENDNFIDFVVWKESSSYQDGFDITETEFNILTDPENFGLYEVQIAGELGVYCDDDEQLDIFSEWQITVEYETDIQILQYYDPAGEFSEDMNITKTEINPAPYVFIPSIGEVIDYSYTFPANSRVTIRILDFNGKFVISLVDKFYQKGGIVSNDEAWNSWDGRNRLGQIVPPGTYLMHIESTMWETGEISTDIAPVVVGVYK